VRKFDCALPPQLRQPSWTASSSPWSATSRWHSNSGRKVSNSVPKKLPPQFVFDGRHHAKFLELRAGGRYAGSAFAIKQSASTTLYGVFSDTEYLSRSLRA